MVQWSITKCALQRQDETYPWLGHCTFLKAHFVVERKAGYDPAASTYGRAPPIELFPHRSTHTGKCREGHLPI